MKGLREGGRGESKGRVHGNPFPHCLYGTLRLCSRERRFTHQRFQFTVSKGGKREGKKDMRCEETGLRMWRRIEGGAGRGREGEKSRGKRETAVSLCGDHPPVAVARTQREERRSLAPITVPGAQRLPSTLVICIRPLFPRGEARRSVQHS